MPLSDTAKPAAELISKPASNFEQLGGELDHSHTPSDGDRQRSAVDGARLIQSLHENWSTFSGIHDANALALIDGTFERVITALRRDARFATISRADIEMLLADARRDVEFDVERHSASCVELADLRDLAERGFPVGGAS